MKAHLTNSTVCTLKPLLLVAVNADCSSVCSFLLLGKRSGFPCSSLSTIVCIRTESDIVNSMSRQENSIFTKDFQPLSTSNLTLCCILHRRNRQLSAAALSPLAQSRSICNDCCPTQGMIAMDFHHREAQSLNDFLQKNFPTVAKSDDGTFYS